MLVFLCFFASLLCFCGVCDVFLCVWGEFKKEIGGVIWVFVVCVIVGFK